MSWTECVPCSGCMNVQNHWAVIDGVWTCDCGRHMTMSAIRAMQRIEEGTDLSPETRAMLIAEAERDRVA